MNPLYIFVFRPYPSSYIRDKGLGRYSQKLRKHYSNSLDTVITLKLRELRVTGYINNMDFLGGFMS